MAVPSQSSLPPPEVNTLDADNWCCSNVKVDKFKHIWIINILSLRHEGVVKFLESSEFSASATDTRKWCLCVHPNGGEEIHKEYLSLFLVLADCDSRKVWAKFKFSILSDKREETNKLQITQPHGFLKGNNCGYGQFIKRDFLLDEANGLLPGDTLTIFCEVTVMSDSENISGQCTAVQFKVPECRLFEDLQSLLENSSFSDVTLSVRGRVFHAHKNFLAHRSPVFSAMFEHDMEERKLNTVNITDIDQEVFKKMLSFIYTGQTTSLENIAQDLLPAADKYALERLKVMCDEALCKSLSVDKAVDILILADRHSADQLKAQAVNYIYMHAADVMQTQGWEELVVSHPHLTIDVFRVMAMQQKTLCRPP